MLLNAIAEIWTGKDVRTVMNAFNKELTELDALGSGWPSEFILHTMEWILQQEDVNFRDPRVRSPDKLQHLNEIIQRSQIPFRNENCGSLLAMSLLCDIVNGTHPVEALRKAGLEVGSQRKLGER